MLQEDGEFNVADETPPDASPIVFPPKFHVMGAYPAKGEAVAALEQSLIDVSAEEMRWVGVNGRCNKVADTCYTFWVGGSLAVSTFLPFGSLSVVIAGLIPF